MPDVERLKFGTETRTGVLLQRRYMGLTRKRNKHGGDKVSGVFST